MWDTLLSSLCWPELANYGAECNMPASEFHNITFRCVGLNILKEYAEHYFHHEDNEDEDGDGPRSILDVKDVILSRNITSQDPSTLIMTLIMKMTMTIIIFMMLNNMM